VGDRKAAYGYWRPATGDFIQIQRGGLEEESCLVFLCVCWLISWDWFVHIKFTAENVATNKTVYAELCGGP